MNYSSELNLFFRTFFKAEFKEFISTPSNNTICIDAHTLKNAFACVSLICVQTQIIGTD